MLFWDTNITCHDAVNIGTFKEMLNVHLLIIIVYFQNNFVQYGLYQKTLKIYVHHVQYK